MANYHPHGDTAIYDALVRMGQPFSLTAPLIDKHGNFGSPSDPPAASRYTECRLSPLAMELLAGHRRGNRRFRAELRRVAHRARRPPGALPEPAGERRAGHRGGNGHQHPAPQPRRGVQRGGEADRQARRHALGADAHREGPRLPDRRPHHGRRRDQGRVPHRARHRPGARRPRDRGAPGAAGRRSCSPRSRSRRASTRSRAS